MREKFLTYSQEYEDLILYSVFKEIEKGFYVDVGANDPWHISVTKILYEKGWCGINIDPIPSMYEELSKDRPKDINLCLGVGSKESELLFYEMGTASTFNSKIGEEYLSKGMPCTKKIIKVKPLKDVLNKYSENRDIHFLKIDVEGFEEDVLKGMDFQKNRPWVILVESTIPGSEKPTHDKFEYVLTENNYKFVFQHGINRYYVDTKNDKAKKLNFRPVNELLDLYDLYYVFNQNQYKKINKAYKLGSLILTPLGKMKGFLFRLFKKK